MKQEHALHRPFTSSRPLITTLVLAALFATLLGGCGKQAGPVPAPTSAGEGAGEGAGAGGATPAATQADQPYFVLKPGTVYVYRAPGGGETTLTVNASEELTDAVGGRAVTGYPLASDEETIYVTQDQDWVMEVGDAGEGGNTVYKTAKPEFPLHPQAGQSWTKSFADEFAGAGSFVSTVTGFETVQTPAGTFEQAARVEVTFQGPDGSKDHWTEWYAPGVGRVKTSNGLELERVEWPK